MRCPNCGAENEFEGAAFCRSCREPLNAEPTENRGDLEEARQGTDLDLQIPPGADQQHPTQYGPLNARQVESKADADEMKQESDPNQEKPSDPGQQHPAQYEPLNAGPVESKAHTDETKQETDPNQEKPPDPGQQRPSQYEPLNTGPAESRTDFGEAKQEPVSNQDKPPDPDQQDPGEDEQLRLSDPIDFMINEVPDDSSYYAGVSGKDSSGGNPDDEASDSAEDEFRLSISGGAVGSSVKLEEAINKAIAEMNLPINDFDQKKAADVPKEESGQKPPQELPKKPEGENVPAPDAPNQGEPKPTAVDAVAGDYSETSQAKQQDQQKEQEIVPEARPEETAQTPPEETGNQEPPQATRAEVRAEVQRPESPTEPQVSQPSPVATMVEARKQEPAEATEQLRQETPPTEKLSPTEKWNSVLSIKPKPSPAGSAEAKDLPRVSQSKGLILLSGNNLILTGGRKVLSGEEVRIGDQLYEVRIKPEDKKRKLIIGAAAAAAFLIILLAIFAGGGNGRLVGILVDNNGNYPLGEQTVRIAELNKTVQTNLAGFFVFDDLSPGLYTIQYMSNGTAMSEVKIAILKSDLTTVTLHSRESAGSLPSR